MRKFLLLLLGVLCTTASLLAQNRTISGKVTNSQGEGVANVSVTVKGSTVGTTTDNSGSFSLNVPSGTKTLIISSIGYQDQEISIEGRSNIQISLANVDRAMNEVVVTAYGVTKKGAFTGTASTISNDKFKDLQVSTITGVLQGNASGVLAVSSNGQPGESPTIRVRGIGSVNASSDPLILVDGAPYGGNINNINPNDVETITVLKDASSTALYGSRAANGIISITTKQGKGTPKVAVSALNGWSNRAVDEYNFVNSSQLYQLSWEALKNQATLTPNLITSTGSKSAADYASKTVAGLLVYNPFGVAQPIDTFGNLASSKLLWNENWANDLLRTGYRQDYNLSVSSGNEKSRYYISGGYLDDQGIAIESRFKRYTGRLKLDNKINDWLNLGVNTASTWSTQNYPIQGGSAYSNVIGWIRGASSIFPLYLLDPATGAYILDSRGNKQYDFGNNGSLVRPYGKAVNPVATTSMNPTTNDRLIISANGYGEAQLYTGLKFRTQYAVDLYQLGGNTYYNPFVGDGSAYGGRSFKSRDNQSTQTFNNTLTYDRTFANVHHLNFLVGMEAYKYHESYVATEARGFTFPGATDLSYGSTPYSATSSTYDNRMSSYFSRLNYDLGEKYHLSLSVRRDGSSRFADSVRWGTFYSIGGAYNISKEKFFPVTRAISDLKLRASYGTTGNQFLSGFFPYLGGYSAGANVAGYAGSIITSATNGNLTWETQKTLDLGIDFGLLNNRITGSVTYFKRTSENLLFNRPLPPSTGLNGINDNIGTVENHGIEIDLTSVNVKSRTLQWTTTINLSHVENKIVALPQTSISGSGFSNLIVGQSLYNFYLREWAGVDPADGRPTWYMDKTDANGKTFKDTTHTYASATRYYNGSSLPNWTGGMTNSVRYKGFDLNILVAFSIGGKIYDADYAGLMYASVGNQPGQNWSTDMLKRWQKPGDITDVPKLTTTTDYSANSSSTRFLFDGTYARIRNITLGYSLSKSLLSRAHFNNARFFIDWQNPFTFFNRQGLDPEAGLGAITSNTSSVYRTLSVGLNFDF
jgi:TonB-linked SusC/RagA family outer membrane protein